MKRIDPDQVERQRARLDAFYQSGENPAVVKTRLQHAMWTGAGIFRNWTDLEATLSTVDQLSGIALHAKSSRNLIDSCTVQNMCLLASLICRSALIREESRGAHVRTDIRQAWDATNSPFGHTFVSQSREGIERREAAR